jgi:hypothetical protein
LLFVRPTSPSRSCKMNDQMFEKGVFTISLDFELLWGSFDSGKHRKFMSHFARNGGAFETTRAIVDRLLALFQKYDIRVTWATLGHLFLDHCEALDGVKHPDMPRARHSWFAEDWYTYDPCKDFRAEPLWYGRDLIEKILAAEPRHEVGSHSFSHVIFSDSGCTPEVAEAEISKCVELARSFNLKLESFVFPRNQLGHLDLLRKYGFIVTRGRMPFWFTRFQSRTLRRAGHMFDDLLAIPPNCGLPEKSPSGVWVVPVSMFLQSMEGTRRLIPVRSRIKKGITGIERAIRDKSLFHLSFHPTENLCFHTDLMFRALEDVVAHAARRRDEGLLQVMTMSDIGEFCEQRSEIAGRIS